VATALTLAEVAAELAAAVVTVAKSAPAAVVKPVAVVAAPGLVPAAVAVVAAPVAKCRPCSRLSGVLLDQYFAAVRPSLDSSR